MQIKGCKKPFIFYSFFTKSDFVALLAFARPRYSCNSIIVELLNSVRKGIVLPENHGNLVDIDRLYERKYEQDNPFSEINGIGEIVTVDAIDKLPIVLEARKDFDSNGFI